MGAIIAYYRVSTAKQGRSGLGLEGQQAAVEAFSTRRGCEVLASYTEVESGKLAERPQLSKALAHAKRSKATLVVAKLDRLARNVAFLSHLMEAGVDFVAIDLEDANRLTIHILLAVVEGKAKAISDRTKAALQAARARGTAAAKALAWTVWPRPVKNRPRHEQRTAVAADAYTDLLPTMQQLRSEDAGFQQIADKNLMGWNAVQVMRVLARAGLSKPITVRVDRRDTKNKPSRMRQPNCVSRCRRWLYPGQS